MFLSNVKPIHSLVVCLGRKVSRYVHRHPTLELMIYPRASRRRLGEVRRSVGISISTVCEFILSGPLPAQVDPRGRDQFDVAQCTLHGGAELLGHGCYAERELLAEQPRRALHQASCLMCRSGLPLAAPQMSLTLKRCKGDDANTFS